jgi:hypothetical protein
LTELIVVCGSFVVLGLLVFATAASEGQTFIRNNSVNAVQRTLRVWLARMATDVRKSGYNPLGTTPNPFVITSRTCTDFEFSLDADSDGSLATSGASYPKEQIGYRWNSGSSSLQMKNGAAWRTLLSDVQSLNFTYRRADATRTVLNSDCSATPTWPTQDIGEVQITITAEADGGYAGAAPVTVAETTTVRLRNEVP